MVDHDRQLGRDLAQLAGEVGQHAPIAPQLHDPSEFAHHRPEGLEHVEADPAHVAGLPGGREDMKAQPAHAAPMPVAQRRRRNARIGDGDAAHARTVAIERIEHDAVVVAVGVALHDHAARQAKAIQQRDVIFGRRRRRRVAAARRERELFGRTEDVGVGVPRARGRQERRAARIRNRSCDQRRVVNSRCIVDRVSRARRSASEAKCCAADPGPFRSEAVAQPSLGGHPSLMFASRTTLPHLSISDATKTRNSSGVFSRASTLSWARRATMSGCRSTAFKPALSLPTMSGAVPAGANTPCHS